jgi:hypothetical protein
MYLKRVTVLSESLLSYLVSLYATFCKLAQFGNCGEFTNVQHTLLSQLHEAILHTRPFSRKIHTIGGK